MRQDDKIREMEKLLEELKTQKDESAATIAEYPSRSKLMFWKIPLTLFKIGRKSF